MDILSLLHIRALIWAILIIEVLALFQAFHFIFGLVCLFSEQFMAAWMENMDITNKKGKRWRCDRSFLILFLLLLLLFGFACSCFGFKVSFLCFPFLVFYAWTLV
jgi:hypothetical protein